MPEQPNAPPGQGEQSTTPTPQRARRQGQRMTKAERLAAQDAFIKAMENTANVRAACLQAGIDSSTVYYWQEHDETFGFRFKQANTQANWLLFAEAWSRAMTGETRYVVSRGDLVYKKVPDGKGGFKDEPVTYREKSDRLLELLLKARLPEFREKTQVEHSGSLASGADVRALHEAIAEALADYPEARVAVAAALARKG